MRARLRDGLHRLEDAILAGALALLVLLSAAQIVMREAFATGWVWAEPASRTLVLWLAMLGALAATRDHKHIAIDALPRLLPPGPRRVAWTITQAFAALLCGAMAWYCWQMLEMERAAPATLFGPVPTWVGMLILPAAFALMALRFALSVGLPPPQPDNDGLG